MQNNVESPSPSPLPGLRQIDVATLRPVFDDPAAAVGDSRVTVADRRHLRRVERRRFLDGQAVAQATALIETLPAPGESLHAVTAGNWHSFAAVQAVVRLALPATVRQLNFATLGINDQNVAALLAWLEDGTVGRCSVIASTYFRANEGRTAAALIDGLRSRRQRVAVLRNHAKVCCIELSDGRCYVLETSANARSCKATEQFVLSHDRELLRFHRRWMLAAIAAAEALQ